ncbi:MAG: hypothetical protein H7144_02850 [Burkholderiales bacterium]|nr:hypothetical protein [Phycisphaerae bacterium]
MSQAARQRWLGIFGLVLLGAIGYGCFIAVRAAFHVIDSMKSDIAMAIIAAGATVLVSILSILLGKVYEARERIQNQHREKKVPVYEELIQFISRVLSGEKIGTAPTQEEIIKFGFNQKMMVWGADEVLLAWVKWLRAISDAEVLKADPLKGLFLYEELILAIRRDLGHKNKSLKRGDVLRLFVNDIDVHLLPAGKMTTRQ